MFVSKHLAVFAVLVLTVCSSAGPAFAQGAPKVAASIKPIHSLVSAVMQNVGEPHLIVRGGASPHTFSMRPSDAEALEQADLIFWVGPELEVFLTDSIASLAGDAIAGPLDETPGLTLLPLREGSTFDPHEHEGAEPDAAHDHEHEDHEAEDHDHQDEDPDHTGHEHEHGEMDMHLWLDPANAAVLVNEIADRLAQADPENAATYMANAEALYSRLDSLTSEIADQLAPVRDKPFIVFHDAYHYFESRFGVEAAGSVTISPEAIPGVRRISEIHDKIAELDAVCVFSEPQFEPSLISVVIEGTDARTGTLDPLGAALEDGPDLYFQLIRDLAGNMRDCLAP